MKYQTIAIVTSYVKCGLIFANIIDSNLGHARGHIWYPAVNNALLFVAHFKNMIARE